MALATLILATAFDLIFLKTRILVNQWQSHKKPQRVTECGTIWIWYLDGYYFICLFVDDIYHVKHVSILDHWDMQKAKKN